MNELEEKLINSVLKHAVRPNQGVQRTPLARPVGWARSTRQSATACWQPSTPQPSGATATYASRRSTGRPHAHCLAAASCRRPPPCTRLPAAQLTPGVGPPSSVKQLSHFLRAARVMPTVGPPPPVTPLPDTRTYRASCRAPGLCPGRRTPGSRTYFRATGPPGLVRAAGHRASSGPPGLCPDRQTPSRTTSQRPRPNTPCSRPRWRGRQLGASLDARRFPTRMSI